MIGIDYLFNEHQRIFWLYLASAFVIALYFVWRRPEYRKILFAKTIWWHRSAQLDYLYFFVIALIKALLIAPLLFSAAEVALAMVKGMQLLFGYQPMLRWEKTAIVLLYTLALFVVSDLTRYWLHRMMHRIPLLWRFHRVHHSAEVLNPATFYRVHPVENLLFGLRYALSAGFVSGIFIYFFGARVGLVEFLGANAFVVLFTLAGANLRHSHLPLRFPAVFEKIFVSPYMHQLHHSTTHTHTNFGGALSIWDALFGTRLIQKSEDLRFGIDENVNHNSVLALLFEPFNLHTGTEK
ncbi:sterol desaturase family protein [Sulfurimonas sp. HSL3-7]|uniref:sterol desaturase family protein n=1 Tax=Sulfonitrofixus jiaomeiensis TaxID=3131938 RepID=UPI0031F85FD5